MSTPSAKSHTQPSVSSKLGSLAEAAAGEQRPYWGDWLALLVAVGCSLVVVGLLVYEVILGLVHR